MEQVGRVPLKAFYVGLGLELVSVVWNVATPSPEDWNGVGQALVLLVISGIAFLYALGFGVTALVQYLQFRRYRGVDTFPAKVALLLHTGMVIGITVGWIFALN